MYLEEWSGSIDNIRSSLSNDGLGKMLIDRLHASEVQQFIVAFLTTLPFAISIAISFNFDHTKSNT